jgi:hypothetical protein
MRERKKRREESVLNNERRIPVFVRLTKPHNQQSGELPPKLRPVIMQP